MTRNATTNSQVEAKNWARGRQIKFIAIRLKPQKVIKEARGTITTLAKTVIGEKI